MQVEAEAPVQGPPSFQDIGISLSGVARRYGRRSPVVALDGLDLEWAPASWWRSWARPGCGKSTLLELVAGLQEPDAGS